MPQQAEYFLLDVFTRTPYGGNQLAIFPDATHIPEDLLQKIARELNLSETVYLYPPEQGGDCRMRIFTLGKELPTAGHPTVGTAFFLASQNDRQVPKMTLEQKIGLITVDIDYEANKPSLVTMHQPLPVFGGLHVDKKAELASLLSLTQSDLLEWPLEEVSCGNNVLMIAVKDVQTLGQIKFRLDVWDQIAPSIGHAFIYAFATKGETKADVQGRMFAPEVGIIEDPATGSANGPLACYLTKYKIIEMPALSFQGVEMGRPSQLYLKTKTDASGEITDVAVGGHSVITGKGVHFITLE